MVCKIYIQKRVVIFILKLFLSSLQCQDTMVQFGSYLFQMVTIEELNDRLPSIGTLLSDCHVNADVAFFLARPLFINMLNVCSIVDSRMKNSVIVLKY